MRCDFPYRHMMLSYTSTRSGSNGSPIEIPTSVSGPCASLVTLTGLSGTRFPTCFSAVSTSSGRTDGVICRTTTWSMTHSCGNWVSAGAVTALSLTLSMRRMALRASKTLSPDFVIRSTNTSVDPRSSSTAPITSSTEAQISISHRLASKRAEKSLEVASMTSMMSRPGGNAESSSIRNLSGSQSWVTPISTYSASLATPVGAELE